MSDIEKKLNTILINQGLLAGMIQTVAIAAAYPPGSERETRCLASLERHSQAIMDNIKEFDQPSMPQGDDDGKS